MNCEREILHHEKNQFHLKNKKSIIIKINNE